ncbi:MAG: hypothetical protein ABSC19_05225 [Syntrophorhabdales bacterium]|jgi:hypothetical protein
MSIPGAIIAGLVATLILYVLTRLTTMNRMGMERYLSTMFFARANATLGFTLLFVAGGIFGLIYAYLWSMGIGWPDYLYGLINGVVQWLAVGLAIGLLPLVHRGIRSGDVPPPGFYMTNLLGKWAFLAGLVNHAIFGLAIAFVYQFFRGRYG